MDPSLYKTLFVSGSFNYRYYYQAPKPGKFTLLFLHGFPSLANHWAKQVEYFTGKGYGVIALDMLGYGGSSKPVEIRAYAGIQHAQDCISILNEENVDKVVVIGHDWGCRVTSRLADLFPDRHIATIYISVGYGHPVLDGNATIERIKSLLGRDNFGYWKFFNSDEAPQLIAKHIDSFHTLIFSSDPTYWINHFAPEGAMKEWLLADRKAPIKPWAPDKATLAEFDEDDWRAATNWYRVGMRMEYSEREIALNDSPRVIKHPVLVIGTTNDAICLPSFAKASTEAACGGPENAQNLTYKEIETTHWPMLEKPDELNAIIDEYINGLPKA